MEWGGHAQKKNGSLFTSPTPPLHWASPGLEGSGEKNNGKARIEDHVVCLQAFRIENDVVCKCSHCKLLVNYIVCRC